MKKLLALTLAILTAFSFSACAKKATSDNQIAEETPVSQRESITPGPHYAYDYAKMQEAFPESAVRIVEDSTTIKLTIGDKVMYGSIDNEVASGVELLNMLPLTVHMTRNEASLGGKLEKEISYESSDVHYGWLNGDIDYYAPEQSLMIYFANQDFSYEENGHINLGSVIGNLSDWYNFSNEYDVLIEAVTEE